MKAKVGDRVWVVLDREVHYEVEGIVKGIDGVGGKVTVQTGDFETVVDVNQVEVLGAK